MTSRPAFTAVFATISTITVDSTNVRAGARFEGGKMIISDPVYGDDVWECIEQSIPANLSEFVGVYSSEEAESVLRVVIENGNLAIHRRPNSSFALKPTYADAFHCSLGNVHFLRDATQKIVALSLSGPRVWTCGKRLASAVRFRPWPPCFQQLTRFPFGILIPFHSKTMARDDSPRLECWSVAEWLASRLAAANRLEPRTRGRCPLYIPRDFSLSCRGWLGYYSFGPAGG